MNIFQIKTLSIIVNKTKQKYIKKILLLKWRIRKERNSFASWLNCCNCHLCKHWQKRTRCIFHFWMQKKPRLHCLESSPKWQSDFCMQYNYLWTIAWFFSSFYFFAFYLNKDYRPKEYMLFAETIETLRINGKNKISQVINQHSSLNLHFDNIPFDSMDSKLFSPIVQSLFHCPIYMKCLSICSILAKKKRYE
jgi:hypothetical protein